MSESGSAARAGSNLRTGGQILVDQLRVHGAERVFCVPGESYLAALDAFHDVPDIQVVTCRQEGGAAMMAEAHGKLTGRPGICFVTRGPGATNASAGVHIGFQDSTPMILFIGQVGRGTLDREAFQEIDFRRMFGQMAKWVTQIDDPARIPEFVSRAFHTAASGRPGPVVLALPEDMLTERAATADATRYQRFTPSPSAADMDRLVALFATAKRPIAITGGGDWDVASVADFQAFARRFDLPVAASFRAQSHFDNTAEQFVGNAGIGIDRPLADAIHDSDLVLAVGARLGELTTSNYRLFDIPVPKQPLVHVYPDPEELGRVYQPTLGILSGMKPFAAAAAALVPPAKPAWAAGREALRAAYLDFIKPVPMPGAVQTGEIAAWLSDRLPADAIVAMGAGNYTGWFHKSYQWKGYRTLLGPTSGTMGYGTPAAIAAKLAEPGRIVVALAGDGCFMMHGQELATAVQYGVNIVIIVVNNAMYGTIRMHQEREYPGRITATPLTNPDFATLARAYGAHGEMVQKTVDFEAAFERSIKCDSPALIDLRVDPEASTPLTTITDIRERALARRN
jgi:acetolactate synthase-1/2/3 large subunit